MFAPKYFFTRARFARLCQSIRSPVWTRQSQCSFAQAIESRSASS